MILFVTAQYAGAQYIHPLIKRWVNNKSNIKYKVIATAGSVKYWKECGVRYSSFNNWSPSYTDTYLKKNKVRLILLSASSSSLESLFILSARLFGIRTISFIDMWVNYKNRFLYNNNLVYPDTILSINDTCSKEMIDDGMPKKIIKKIGQPYLEGICKNIPPLGDEILLPLQPIRKYMGSSLGYDEYVFLKTSLNVLSLIGKNIKIRIATHPDSDISTMKKMSIKYNIGKGADDVKNSHTVLGMYSMQMIIAYLWGRKVASVQPGLKNIDPSPLSRWGLIPKIENNNQLICFMNLPLINNGERDKIAEDVYKSTERLDIFLQTNIG